jgi:hypothetical protein
MEGATMRKRSKTEHLGFQATVQGYIATWRARFRQDGWHPTQWGACCDGVNGALLEVFVTDTRQQVLAAYEAH